MRHNPPSVCGGFLGCFSLQSRRLCVSQVKNRESAARSRQRKQAYTTTLEAQVPLLFVRLD